MYKNDNLFIQYNLQIKKMEMNYLDKIKKKCNLMIIYYNNNKVIILNKIFNKTKTKYLKI